MTVFIKDQLQTTIKNFNETLIGGIVTNQTFNTTYPDKAHINTFSWTRSLVRVKAEEGDLYEVERWKPTADLNGFGNYIVHVIRPQNTKVVNQS